MNTRKVIFGLFACSLFLVASCTQNTAAEDGLYEQGVDKTKIINGDKKSVDKTKIINGDKKSVDKTKIINGDKKDRG
ncbi:hypothetical protein [Zeaxanthinibacter enoshimensis]|uniref:hypothetical protein n=1 Tax=Zeaxanthinibacter enoshimensis TaxID=392009 RepID=UPI0035639E0E